MRKKAILTTAFLLSSLLLLTGCAGNSADAESKGGSSASSDGVPEDPEPIVFYTSRNEAQIKKVIADFENLHPQYTGLISYLPVPTQEALERVKAESSNPQADFLWGGTRQQLSQGSANGLFEPLPDSIRKAVPADYQAEDGSWVGEQVLPEVIYYNNQVLSPNQAPTDWSDLVEPAFSGKIGIRDPAPSGTIRTIFDGLIQTEAKRTGSIDGAWDFLKKLDANTVAYPNSADLNVLLQRQQYAVSVWNLQSLLIDKNTNGQDFIEPVVPKSGAIYLIDGIAKIKNSPAGSDVDPFLEYIFSPEVQKSFADDYYQVPTVELDGEPEWLTKLNLHELKLDWDEIVASEAKWIQYWQDNIKTQK